MEAGGPWTYYPYILDNTCQVKDSPTKVLPNPNVISRQNSDRQARPIGHVEGIYRIDGEHLNFNWRNNALQQLLHEKDEEITRLTENCNQLRTRLSEIGAVQLTAGNPNITDLSDPNRPDKLAEQFSELYDNQWTDCFQTMVDDLKKTEEEAVHILLTILKTAYDITLDTSQKITKAAKEALETLVGKSDEEPEKARDTLIHETLHKLKSYRTKHFRLAPKDIAKVMEEKLLEKIGEQLITTCRIYIEECVRICWLMCIKDPPMYIFCEKEDIFDKKLFAEYTEKGHAVSYVVWPVLYLHHNGPLMRKGVAQGVGKRKPNKSEVVGSYTVKMMPAMSMHT